MTVWVVDSGEYEQNGVDGVFSSLDAAFEGIKRSRTSAGYPCEWDSPKKHADVECYYFSRYITYPKGPHWYSQEWTSRTLYTVTPYEVDQV